jgi:hypothetical protein
VFSNISEKILLAIFTIINISLYLYSYDGATFMEGADASQYFNPALSFVERGEFLSGTGKPLTFGPPLYSIFLAVPIYVFGFDESAAAIVFLQCALLYLTGFLSRYILLQFSSKFGLLLHALVIFNPNSLITAHLVQSETLFTFLIIWSVVIAFKTVTDFSLKNIILLGVLTGLATLIRPVALYLLLLWPLFILIVSIIKTRLDVGNPSVYYQKRKWAKLLIIVLIGGLVISPWYVRNYITFGEVFFSSNAGDYLENQYLRLKNKGAGWSLADANKEHEKIFIDYLTKEGKSNFCLNNTNHWSCSTIHARVSLSAIIDEPLAVHVKALIDSWGTLFFSGGASNIRNYLGFDGKSLIVDFQNNSFSGLDSILKLVRDMNFPYFFVFVLTMTFTVITRIVGFVGIFYLLKNREWRPYGLLLIEIISIFVAAYLYLGQSRFRVPLEPLLMLFTTIGILYMAKGVKMAK